MVLIQEGLHNTAQRENVMQLIHQQDITTLQLQIYLQQYQQWQTNLQQQQLAWDTHTWQNNWQWYATNNQPMEALQTQVPPQDGAQELLGIPPPLSPPLSPPQELPPQIDQQEEEQDIPKTFMETMVLNDFLTIYMPKNIEKKYMIFIPLTLKKTSLNIYHDPFLLEEKYVILMIQTINDNLLPAALYNPPHMLMHLELALATGGLQLTMTTS